MNNFDKILNNGWTQILILIILFWFMFLKEDFSDLPLDETLCDICSETIFNKNNNIGMMTFKNSCIAKGGTYKKENNIISCINYKAILDSNYKCKCEIN